MEERSLRVNDGKTDRPPAHKSCLRMCAIEQVSKGRGNGSGPSSQRAEPAQAVIDQSRKTVAKTIRVLGRKNHIRILRDLKKALYEDKLQDIKGIGKKTLDTSAVMYPNTSHGTNCQPKIRPHPSSSFFRRWWSRSFGIPC